jgi:succinate dehydrogenase/fumarate reductase cytochrome b subunit
MYGELHLTSHGTVFKPDEWHYRLLTVLRIVGGVSVFGPIWWLALWRRGWVGCLALAGIAGVGIALGCADLVQVLAWYEKIKTAVPHQLNGFFVIFTALGFATLASIAVESSLSLARDSSAWRRDADARFLEVILLGLVVFNVVSVPFNAVRHLLLAFLAMAWLTARTAGSMRANGLAWVLMIASTLLGASLAVGDYDYAAGYRTFAKTVIRQARQEVERRVWFTGTWGFKYYAEREGAQAYYPGIQRTDQGQPIAGDIVFHSQMLNWAPVMRTVPNAFLESYVPLEGRWPMRPVVPGACYYGVSRHLLPWGFYLPEVVDPSSGSFTVVPLDVIAVWGVHSQTAP